jgi:hypothetical protein
MLEAPAPLKDIYQDETFAALASDDQTRVLAELEMIKRSVEAERESDKFEDRELRLSNGDRMRVALTDMLKVLTDEPVGVADALHWLAGHHGGKFNGAFAELRIFKATAQRLLDGAEAFKPEPGRKDRGGGLLKVELKQFAFDYLIALIEGVGVRVTSTTGGATKEVRAPGCSRNSWRALWAARLAWPT